MTTNRLNKALKAALVVCLLGCDRPAVAIQDHVHHSKARCELSNVTEYKEVGCVFKKDDMRVSCISLYPEPEEETRSCDVVFTETGQWAVDYIIVNPSNGRAIRLPAKGQIEVYDD
jgi:hypothetical protein